MKIILASTIYPFVQGGATLFVEWLALALQARGHLVDTLLLPFSSDHATIPDQMLAIRMLDVSMHGDLLIAVRPPSYLLRHPRKVIWLIHQHRTAYDLWGTEYQDIPDTPEGVCTRDAIVHADTMAFRESSKIFCNSKVVAARLARFNGIDGHLLHPPLWAPERYRNGACGDYIFYVSRIVDHKRQLLAVEALRYTNTPVKLVIAGPPDPDAQTYLRQIEIVIRDYNLESKVVILPRWIADQDKIDLFAGCLAALYIPFDEDSYGYPTLEAYHSGKAVITANDSGGTLELIVDGENGLIAEPQPQAIAAAMDRLYLDRPLAERMGCAGRERLSEMGIGWDHVVKSLTA